jgi:hypothetical protein
MTVSARRWPFDRARSGHAHGCGGRCDGLANFAFDLGNVVVGVWLTRERWLSIPCTKRRTSLMSDTPVTPYALAAGRGWTYNFDVDFVVKVGERGQVRRLAVVE